MNNKECMVSIVCITYNQSEYIKKAIDSMLSQKTDFNFEIIIHDDASTDGTTEILKDYEERYPKIINVIYEKENLYSQNIEFISKIISNYTHGRYIAFCEGDDYWIDENKLQIQVDALEKRIECDMCACRAVMVSADGRIVLGEIRPQRCDGILCMDDVIVEGATYLATAGLVFRKKMTDKRMRFETLWESDYVYQMRGALRGGIVYIDKAMAVYRRYAKGSHTVLVTSDEMIMENECSYERKVLEMLDQETNGRYHDAIVKRLGRFGQSFYVQLVQNRSEIMSLLPSGNTKIYIWGSGLRGKNLEKFCASEKIKLMGVCDILNKNLGGITNFDNTIVSTDEALIKADIILTSVTSAYDYVMTCEHRGKVIDMQVYMPIA